MCTIQRMYERSILLSFHVKGVSRERLILSVTYSTQNLRFAHICNLLRCDRRDLSFLHISFHTQYMMLPFATIRATRSHNVLRRREFDYSWKSRVFTLQIGKNEATVIKDRLKEHTSHLREYQGFSL